MIRYILGIVTGAALTLLALPMLEVADEPMPDQQIEEAAPLAETLKQLSVLPTRPQKQQDVDADKKLEDTLLELQQLGQ